MFFKGVSSISWSSYESSKAGTEGPTGEDIKMKRCWLVYSLQYVKQRFESRIIQGIGIHMSLI